VRRQSFIIVRRGEKKEEMFFKRLIVSCSLGNCADYGVYMEIKVPSVAEEGTNTCAIE
jgi:hypothetical protein